MTQAELESAVAARTGESLRAIRRRGFSLLRPLADCDPDESCHLPPQAIDWDELERQPRRAA